MLKTRQNFVMITTNIVVIFLLVFLTRSIIPEVNAHRAYSDIFTLVTVVAIFLAVTLLLHKISGDLIEYLQADMTKQGVNPILSDFSKALRFCYSLDDFKEIIGSILEERGDCAVLYIDNDKNYVLYNSPNKLTTKKDVMLTLQMNFNSMHKNGFYFIGNNFGLVDKQKNARGFFLVYEQQHFYVFCRYTKLFDEALFKPLFDEFSSFSRRVATIGGLSEIAELSSEWQQLAETQRSFLPPQMPTIKHLKLAAYYRPLVNVSGDYYTVLPISPSKTLLMLGDVSGKGLAAALVMGLVMNTVKILEDKDDLPNMIRAVDKAIKGMKLQDKYTVLFLGIVDTDKMTIRYINASMSDPIVISKSPDGYKIKPLTSNCSLVGIIELDDLTVAEQKLFRGDVILMASDGVSEVMNDEGIELGTTKLYQNTIKSSATKGPKEFIDDVVKLILTYNGGKKLRDDVTMLVAKVEG